MGDVPARSDTAPAAVAPTVATGSHTGPAAVAVEDVPTSSDTAVDVAVSSSSVATDAPGTVIPAQQSGMRGSLQPENAEAEHALDDATPGTAPGARVQSTPLQARLGSIAVGAVLLLPAEEEAVSVTKRMAGLAAKSLAKPLEYQVVRKGTVSVRSAPDAKAKELGQLPSGSRVFGFPGRGWLWLRDSGKKRLPPELVGHWVFIGCRLQATCLRMWVEARFPEALDVAWEGVPARQAVYSVEWRPVRSVERVVGLSSTDSGGSTGGHTLTGGPHALLCGILAGATVQTRVAARITGPSGSDQDVRVLGPWSELDTGPWIPEEMELDPQSWVDPKGISRGGCSESKCVQFVWSNAGRWSYDLARCLRCGQAVHKHEKKIDVDGDDTNNDSLAPYVVKHSQVIVRRQRHVQSDALGTLKMGARVLGVPTGEWLRVEVAPIRSLLLLHQPPDVAHTRGWVLLDGSQVGLGPLLKPCAAAQPQSREMLSKEDPWDPWDPFTDPATAQPATAQPCPAGPRAFPPVAGGSCSSPPPSPFLCVPLGVGCAVPKLRITNTDLQCLVDKPEEWIRARTGVASRHVLGGVREDGDDDAGEDGAGEADGDSLSRLSSRAAEAALELSGCKASDLDLILLCTSSPEDLFGDATTVASKIGADNAVAFDLTAACSGFLFGVVTASQFLHTGTYRRALVIGADALSRWVDWGDRSTSVLFGDGAGAMVLAAVEGGAQHSGLLGFAMHSDGRGHEHLTLPFCGSPHELKSPTMRRQHPLSLQKGGYSSIAMNGSEVYSFAVQRVPEVILEALDNAGLSVAQADWFVLHQANIRILEEVAHRLWIPSSKLITNLHSYGNTSAASIPLALTGAVQRGDVKFGDVIVCAGFGAGLSWGAAVLRWGAPRMAGLAPVRDRALAAPRACATAAHSHHLQARGRAGGLARGASAPPR
uniref:3-ketoacyl acyl carrier protein synthase III n=1 Tax=Gambierdiscus excentricus TaxID=986170 RepID=A0A1S6K7U6_9DINO|nr:3-ketoacyl acyl carrier protein synthase III [Gambierdiscus excentricus]